MAAKYRLRLGNELHEVEVEPDHAGGWRVKVGDDLRVVNLQRINEGARYSLIVDGRPYDIFAEEGPTDYHILVDGERVIVGTQTGRRGSGGDLDADLEGEWVLKSPMAGVVREVRVSADDEVEEDAVLVVVEAMKMQNELKARRAGQVKAVYVTVGQRVDQGTPLLVLV
jgi:biotin carboxyl carrier protein